MNIIITNDDGIHGEGLHILANWTRQLGHVTVVAPKFEQSGKSHAIELHKPFEIKRVPFENGITAYTVDSTPADCVRYALLGAELPCDLLLSGINRGPNLGQDIIYSGTVGAAFEAAALGYRAVSVSTDFTGFDAAREHLDMIGNYFMQRDLLSHGGLYNVNIPDCTAVGVRITRQGGPYYTDGFRHEGNDMYQAVGRCIYEDRNDMTLDTDAFRHGYISISPLTIDRTNTALFDKLRSL